MTTKSTELLGNSSNETRSVFYCPESPQYIWDLNHKTSFKIIVVITVIACPITILLNLLVIIAVKTRRELKKNSNILLSSMALADLLVGAVSMPLSITLDTLVIQRVLLLDIICTHDRCHRRPFNVHHLRCFSFTFAPYCLGEVCGDNEMHGVQGYCYRTPGKEVHESYKVISSNNCCSIRHNDSC